MSQAEHKRALNWFTSKYSSHAVVVDVSTVTDRSKGLVEKNEYDNINIRVCIEYKVPIGRDGKFDVNFVSYTERDETKLKERDMAFSSYES